MPEVPEFLDARNVRRLIIEYGREEWSQEELDRLLRHIGLPLSSESMVIRGPTPPEIEAARTPAGGWTRAQLAVWGVAWPPPKGWRARLERR